MTKKPAFVGGALSFKGDKKKKAKKRKSKSKHALKDDDEKRREAAAAEVTTAAAATDDFEDDDDDMTEAERKALKKRLEMERRELEQVASKSHRERIEEFNEKLGALTEHNDIPRVSAAGNG